MALSCLPILLYEGLLTLFAAAAHNQFTPDRLAQITAVGGLLIMAIGINMLGLLKIKVSNLLPAIVLAVTLAPLFAT